MSSADLRRFFDSMQLTYEQWHDGEGYDLNALERLSDREKLEVEEKLLSRQTTDWRDIEALDHLGTPAALARLQSELKSSDLTIRIEAAERLRARNSLADPALEALILEALDTTTLLNGMTRVLSLAKRYSSPAVREKVLSKALTGNDDLRVHAAALAHHLYGGTHSDFDWNHRPLYLRFNAPNEAERKLAFDELCALIEVDPRI